MPLPPGSEAPAVEEPRWARVVVRGPTGAGLVLVLAGPGRPELSTIEGLAWLRLAVRRTGGDVWLEEVGEPLGELLDLVGLHGRMTGTYWESKIGVYVDADWAKRSGTEEMMTDSMPPIGLGVPAGDEVDPEDGDALAGSAPKEPEGPEAAEDAEARVEEENDLA